MSDNGIVRCPLCHEAVEIESLSGHLHQHSTWTIFKHSFKQWPAWTAATIIAGLALIAAFFAAIGTIR